MANNQHSRKVDHRIDAAAEEDPFAELARIVGYDQTPARSHDGRPETPAIDLEAELLRGLGMPERAAPIDEDKAIPANEGTPARDGANDDAADPSDDLNVSADEMMTLSLEDELMREFENGDASFPQDASNQAKSAEADDGAAFAEQSFAAAGSDDGFEGFVFPDEEPSEPSLGADRPEPSMEMPRVADLAEESGEGAIRSDEPEADLPFLPLAHDFEATADEPDMSSASALFGSGHDTASVDETRPATDEDARASEMPAEQPSDAEDFDSSPLVAQADDVVVDDAHAVARHPEDEIPADGFAPEAAGDAGSQPGDAAGQIEHEASDAKADWSDAPLDAAASEPEIGEQPVEFAETDDPSTGDGSPLDDWLRDAMAAEQVASQELTSPVGLPPIEAEAADGLATGAELDEAGPATAEFEAGQERPVAPAASEDVSGQEAPEQAFADHGDGLNAYNAEPVSTRHVDAGDTDPVLQDEPAAPVRPAELHQLAAPLSVEGDPSIFDAGALLDHEEPVAVTPDLHIPALPVEETAEARPADDFELGGMDEEVADLLSEPDHGALDRGTSASSTATWGVATSVPFLTLNPQDTAAFDDHAAAHIDLLDGDAELERALDESLEAAAAGETASNEVVEESDPVPAPAAAPSRSSRWKSIGVPLGGFVFLAAIGAVVWQSSGSSHIAKSSGPRVITADKTPAKQKPKDPGGKTVPNQNKIVYDRVRGGAGEAPDQKSLVTSAEKPVDIVQHTLEPDKAIAARGKSSGTTSDAPFVSPEAQKGQARLAPQQSRPADSGPQAPQGVTPHFVQTMTVTADGKLVPAAGAEPSDATQPAASSPPAGGAAPSANDEGTATGPADDQGAAASPADDNASAATPSGAANAVEPPLPTARPAYQGAAGGSTSAAPAAAAAQAPAAATPVAAAPAPTAAKAAAPAPATANPGGYFIQIASQPTEAGAKASYANLARRYGSVIGGHGVDIQQAKIAGKGVYYRVRIAAGSRDDASSMCKRYAAAGGSCFVTR